MPIQAVIALITDERRILLAWKQRKVNKGFLTNPGGKIEPGQTSKEAVVDEVWREIGISCEQADCEKVGTLLVWDRAPSKNETELWEIEIFRVISHSGEPRDTEEMKGAVWFDQDHLPIPKMPELDTRWMSSVFQGNNVQIMAEVDQETHRVMRFSMKTYKRLRGK